MAPIALRVSVLAVAASAAPSSPSSAAGGALPSWQQPFLDPLIPPYGGARLLSNRTVWQRLFMGSTAVGAYAMSPMLGFSPSVGFLASWKLSAADEDEPGPKIMYAYSADGATWLPSDASDGRNVLFPSMNSSENPRVALFAEPPLLLDGRMYAAASPRQFCLYPDQYQDILLLRRVLGPGSFGPLFWAAPVIPPGFALASAAANVSALPQQDAQTRADVALLSPDARARPCAAEGTSKCEACVGACQPWPVALNISSLENERTHWVVPRGGGAEVLLYRSHNRVLYASRREAPGGEWTVPVPTNITDTVSNFNGGNLPASMGGGAYLVSNALITIIRDPLFFSFAPDGVAFTSTAAIGSCEDAAVFASPQQPWGCLYRIAGGAKEGGLQYPQAAVVTHASAPGLFVIVSLNKEDIWIARTPLEDLPQ